MHLKCLRSACPFAFEPSQECAPSP
jgi:hypothetical protein